MGDKAEKTCFRYELTQPGRKRQAVFNAEQCEDLPAHYSAKAEPPAFSVPQRIERADRFFATTGATQQPMRDAPPITCIPCNRTRSRNRPPHRRPAGRFPMFLEPL